jgi:hypothetical protein
MTGVPAAHVDRADSKQAFGSLLAAQELAIASTELRGAQP